MIFPLSLKTPLQNFKLLSHCLIPRPIAWVSSLNDNGSINLAPFSFFSVVSLEPAILSLCLMKKSDGLPKDTLQNARTRQKLSISIPSLAQEKLVQECSKELDSGISEAAEFGIDLEVLHSAYPPVPKGVKVAFFCEFHSVLDFASATDTLLVELKEIYVNDALCNEGLDFEFDALARSGRGFKNLTPLN